MAVVQHALRRVAKEEEGKARWRKDQRMVVVVDGVCVYVLLLVFCPLNTTLSLITAVQSHQRRVTFKVASFFSSSPSFS